MEDTQVGDGRWSVTSGLALFCVMANGGRPRRTELDVLRAAAATWENDDQDMRSTHMISTHARGGFADRLGLNSYDPIPAASIRAAGYTLTARYTDAPNMAGGKHRDDRRRLAGAVIA